jgi:hypothetical protein
VLLGSQAYSIAPGTGTVAVHLSPRAMKLLKAAKHHVISAVQAATVAGGAKAKGPVRLVG